MNASEYTILRDLSVPIRERHKGPCGPMYFKPAPLRTGASCAGFGGYLSTNEKRVEGFAHLRIVGWCDELVEGIRHKGWYCDDCYGETMRGIVARLPAGRGFLAGWSMGAGMATSFGGEIYETERRAAFAADQEAQYAAEREKEYQCEERERQDAEELDEEYEQLKGSN